MRILSRLDLNNIPALNAQSNLDDPIVYARFYDPFGSWEWFALEYDGEGLFFGLVNGFELELGFFSLEELDAVTLIQRPRIERDFWFRPIAVSELTKRIKEKRDLEDL